MESTFEVIHRNNYHEKWGVRERDCHPFFKGQYVFTSTSEDEAKGVAKFLDRHPEKGRDIVHDIRDRSRYYGQKE